LSIPVICSTLLIEKSPQALPLGAACIASAIKKHTATKDLCNVSLVSFSLEDEDIKTKDDEEAAEILADKLLKIAEGAVTEKKSSSAAEIKYIFCFSVFVWNVNILEKVSILLKKNSCLTIAGGPEITAHPAYYKGFDYRVSGEGELSVPALIAKILNEKKSKSVNISDKNDKVDLNNSVVISKAPELELLASPYLENIIDPAEYEGALWELARGCPFKCSYCYESKGEKRVRLFPMERIKAELELFAKKKIHQVFVLDPTYNVNKKRAIELLKLIREKTPDTFYYFEARAEFIDRELAREFTKIPCALQIGLQSASEEVLKLVNRPFDKKKFIKNIGILNEEGVTFGLDLIYGLPGESFGSFREGIDFAIALLPNNLEIFCLSVLPGTDLYDKAEELGLIFESKAPYHVIKTKSFTPAELERARQLAAACSYFYNAGRAVSWFNSICRLLKIKASKFFEIFYDNNKEICESNNACECKHSEIEKLQLDFLRKLFTERNLEKYYRVAEDIIRFYGAISRTTETGKEEIISLNYNAEYIASDYAADIKWLTQNIRPQKCRIKIYINAGAVDFKFIKN